MLHVLNDILKSKRKKTFCAFIDLKKAFPNVNRASLWDKLSNYGHPGPSNIGIFMLRTIKSMYANIKSTVFHDGQYSPYFGCYNGLREGENLSPILFSLYINDLDEYLSRQNNEGVLLSKCVNDVNCECTVNSV